ncbi:MAG: carboxypeptidase regulatory-like domain-containing protein [Gemmatimonas sp.]
MNRIVWSSLIVAGVALIAWTPNAGAQSASVPAVAAEESGGIIRGVVTNEAGNALPYAVVSIASRELQQFANGSGRFVFTRVPAGKYRINVRQLGYQPVNIDIVLARDSSVDVSVKMQRVATRLATMQVVDEWVCRQPGAPTKAKSDPALVTVFEQLEQNAVRMQLLVKEYPYRTIMERRRILERDRGSDSLEGIDTTITESTTKSQYKVGNVVERAGRAGPHYMRVPTLLDFAQKEFQKNHCFILRGIEERDDRKLIRVDFKASAKILEPDVEGSVYLDPQTYKLRHSEIALTRIPPAVRGLAGLTAITHFDELVSGMPIIAGIRAVSRMRTVTPVEFQRAVENQSALRVTFVKKIPDGVASDTAATRPPL